MANSPGLNNDGRIPILSISPTEEDHLLLRNILERRQCTQNRSDLFVVESANTISSATAALRRQEYEIIICERDLQPGSWKQVLEQVSVLPGPPPVIVTSRLADERLWAEALNLGAQDVLAKPFDNAEVLRVVSAAWRFRACVDRRGGVNGNFTMAAAAS